MDDYERLAWQCKVQEVCSLIEALFWMIASACYFAALFVH
jgi:hypothetical protein